MNSLGLYIHIPWCIQKCPYCDFNSHALKSEFPEQLYIETLLADLRHDLSLLNAPSIISSIFIGGGTPSLFSAQAFENLLTGISQLIPLQQDLEITLEANPGTFESQKFVDYRAIGINRLSIGIQSFNNSHLKSLGRIHTAEEAITAVKIAQRSGFEKLNLDLMFGLPRQSKQQMLDDVKTAINLNPGHLSFYQLTLEPNTYFHKFPPGLPEGDQIYAGQIQCQQLLAEAGYQQYEISAYAKNGQTCQHNLNYWKFGDYLGIGAGAHGKLSLSKPDNIIRSIKAKSPEIYLQNNSASLTKIPFAELPLEYLMNQLRLKSGFTLSDYQSITGLTTETLEPGLSSCLSEGLLIKSNQHFCCSDKGWNFVDSVLEKFIP
ncbi:MAG: radical SAM family heme chaperone HemW [Methylococcales bacterium]|nr:radical SAM family heme chaperone HemW [Methylococcales bacterium]